MSPGAIVVGGGFYGCNVALYLAQVRGVKGVLVLEQGEQLMQRASYTNQARVHCGHHYPRSFTTAYRSRVNFERFTVEFGPAVVDDFTAIYCIARRQSKVTSRQMERFCREIGAPLDNAPADIKGLFNPQLIQSVYVAAERAFNSNRLREVMSERMARAGVEVRLRQQVGQIVQGPDGVAVRGVDGQDASFELTTPMVFNCTYSGLQYVIGAQPEDNMALKHEITEMALVEPPPLMAKLGVTVMDGPFFSCMPFPARGLHSLSHVRYTPHQFWFDNGQQSPYGQLQQDRRQSRAERMIRDAARYMPAIRLCEWRDSLFEVKTVMRKSESDDGRPILFRRHGPYGRVISVLGGKIDNIYDCLEIMDREQIHLETTN